MAVINQCRRGHDYTEANTYLSPGGGRVCRECRKIAKDKYRTTDKGKTAEYRSSRKNIGLRPEKSRARQLLNFYIRTGKVVKPSTCEVNADCWGRIEAHHNNYNKPLEVRWLCMGHHRKVHDE